MNEKRLFFLKITGYFLNASLSQYLESVCLILLADTCVKNMFYTINASALVNTCKSQQRKSL